MFCVVSFYFVLLSILVPKTFSYEYYWREFTGIVQDDAVPYSDGYVGQMYINDTGIKIVTLKNGSTDQRIVGTKILGIKNYNRLKWEPVPFCNETHQIYDKEKLPEDIVVLGGIEHNDKRYVCKYLLENSQTINSKLLILDKSVPITGPNIDIEKEYYWRDFTDNKIPEDAFEAGNNGNVYLYVGQALTDKGLITYEINNSTKKALVPIYGVREENLGLKILCKPLSGLTYFEWHNATSTTVSDVETDEHTRVVGGMEHDMSFGVCRVNNDGQFHIGKLNYHYRSYCYYVLGNQEKWTEEFEVLVLRKFKTL